MSSDSYDILIVGAGLAGIASALRLTNKGFKVLIVEKNAQPGGKIDELTINGFRWDMGPSLFTEPQNIVDLFELFDKNSSDYFQFEEHDESCRYFFQDRTQLTLGRNKNNSMKNIERLVSTEEAECYKSYIDDAKIDFNSIGKLFLDNPIPKTRDYFKPVFIKKYPYFLSKKLLRPLSSYNKRKFASDKMRLIFNRFGTYNGSNPYKMSGLYSMTSDLELNQGTYFPNDGMRSIINALYKLAQEQKIDIKLNSTVEISKMTEGFSYEVSSGMIGNCSKVVCAIDHVLFYKSVMKDAHLFKKFSKKERSTSGLVFYWGINTIIKELGLHNILFSKNYEDEFQSLFKLKKNHSAPTIYIHVSSLMKKNDAPDGCQNLFIMINTSSYDSPSKAYIEKMKEYVVGQLKNQFNVDISNKITTEEYWDNSKIENTTGAYMGALYGPSSNRLTSALQAHPNKSGKHKNLYFCGGTVHPGGGIPLVLRSAKIVANLIE